MHCESQIPYIACPFLFDIVVAGSLPPFLLVIISVSPRLSIIVLIL